jgi:hypothetical protein
MNSAADGKEPDDGSAPDPATLHEAKILESIEIIGKDHIHFLPGRRLLCPHVKSAPPYGLPAVEWTLNYPVIKKYIHNISET